MKRTEVALMLALVLCLGLSACAERAEQEAMDMGALDMAMSDMETAWKQAYEAGDVVALAALYTDDAIYMAPYMGALRGRAAIEARFGEQSAMISSRQITINRTAYGGSGDLSYGVGTYAVQVQMAAVERSMTDNGKYVTVAKRGADGSWKIHVHIWNTNMSEAEVVRMLSGMATM